MPDTSFIEHGRQFPRRYTSAELEGIAKAAGVEKCGPVALEKLQQAAKAFQWGRLVDAGVIASSTNKGRRRQFKHIIKLCEKIEKALNELDALASQLLGPVDDAELIRLRQAAEAALNTIPSRGPNPRRARLQFIGELACIFARLTGQRPTRRVHDQEYGPFLNFVKAALKPFKAATGCETDIKTVLRRLKKGHQRKTNPSTARPRQ
jgi:hypothetical protein